MFGIFLVFLAACSYGGAAIVIKLGYRAGLHPATLLVLQNFVSLALLWPLLLVRGIPKLGRRQLVRMAWQGLLGNFSLSICYFWAAQRIDVSLLSIILFTYPGLVLLYQIVLERHRVATAELVTLVLALFGAILAVNPFQSLPASLDAMGVLLAVGSATTYAFMNVYGQKLSRDLSPLLITPVTTTVSTFAMMAALPARYWVSPALSLNHWLLITALALLSTVLPLNLMYLGLRRIGAYHASVVSVAELPCILILAYFLLNERLTSVQTAGGVMILLSVVLMRPANGSARAVPDPNG